MTVETKKSGPADAEAPDDPRDAEAVQEDKDDKGDTAEARRRRPAVPSGLGRHRGRLGTALLLLVLVAACVTTVLQWREASRLAEQQSTQQQVRTRAAEFAQALLAYRHADLDASRARIRELTATDFGRSYDAAFDGLAEVIGEYRADATATVRDTYVNEIDGDRAKALVVLDSEVRSTAGVRRVLGNKLMLELIREKGRWRVSGLVSLQADDESLTKPDGSPGDPEKEADPLAPEPGKTP